METQTASAHYSAAEAATSQIRGFHESRNDALRGLKQEFGAVPLARVLPLASILRDRPWSLVWVQWFIAYALFPFIVQQLFGAGGISLDVAAWSFGAYFALTWVILLTLVIRPERVGIGRLAQVGVFTAFVGIAIVLVGQQLPVLTALYASTNSDALAPRLAGFVLGVGSLEESAKALPVIWLLLCKRAGYRPLTAAYIGMVSGLAFGVAEAVRYSHTYSNELDAAGIGMLGTYLSTQLLRLISLPLLHGCWSGIVGYFVGLASRYPTAPRALVLIGLLIGATLHGVYDTFSDRWPGAAIAALSLLAFVAYARSTNDGEAEQHGSRATVSSAISASVCC